VPRVLDWLDLLSVKVHGGSMSVPPVLVEYTRGGIVESVHRGWIAVARADGSLVATVGDPDQPVFPRSAMKPFQAVEVVESGAANRFGFRDAELAVCCASHNGEARHRQTVASMLQRVGQPVSAMVNSADPPWSMLEQAVVASRSSDENQLAQNCSGKHAGMVAACVAKGQPVEGYDAMDHPHQVALREIVAAFWRLSPGDLIAGHDNCTLPAYAAPIRNVATGWAGIADAEHAPARHTAAIRRLADAMGNDPFMVAGTDRLNTQLMTVTNGRIVAKDGAEGVLCIADRAQGYGITFKLADGTFRSHGTIMLSILQRLNALTQDEYAQLAALYPAELRDNRDQPVGAVQAVFEWDRA
jgi:L-asparaginase II